MMTRKEKSSFNPICYVDSATKPHLHQILRMSHPVYEGPHDINIIIYNNNNISNMTSLHVTYYLMLVNKTPEKKLCLQGQVD